MKIVINNLQFDYNIGCKILKLKNNECPMKDLEDIWEDIEPLTFEEIAKIPNSEQRRVAFQCFGLEKLISEVNPKLIDKKTIGKTTTWVSQEGELITKKFKDTYELYKVEGEKLSGGLQNKWQKFNDCYFVKFKDTSTDRVYLLWVDLKSVYDTNNEKWVTFEQMEKKVNAIQAIAWTIQTNVKQGKIKEIVRQGDCIMIKPIGKDYTDTTTRHLTEDEYRTLLIAES